MDIYTKIKFINGIIQSDICIQTISILHELMIITAYKLVQIYSTNYKTFDIGNSPIVFLYVLQANEKKNFDDKRKLNGKLVV